MRIVLVGQAPFGKDCLETMLEQGEQIVGVITVPDDLKGRPNPVKDLALEKNIPVLQTPGRSPHRLKDPLVIPWVRDLEPDLFVLVFVTDFMPFEVIKMATYGGINYHPSLLPKYRGGSAINWAVINGEKETGVTVHYIDEGVDTGDIILQEKFPITFEDSVGSVYFNGLYPLGVRLISEAVKLIREGRAPSIPQEESWSSFQPVITEKDVQIDWGKDGEEIHNLIRGSNPSPGAHSIYRGQKIKIWEGELSKTVSGSKPGEVVELVEKKGFKVAAKNSSIIVKKVQLPGEAKISAVEFIKKTDLKPGEKLG
ncbi:methionyl-tRNA formyltransferase [Candidatus Contubernalis alkaliaceticus]|uniref:methionyl-tRNA formyltransferase n=1 Tax=Candidatus Contubernalis alkaliaceticus TaxID=338645 RepID=UPI001F4BDEE8|nr:methionyl-tRNA formyltransferase [Candidatus Contubernalis alkalaceticus]UNC91864.1 methionyl-tRNA formyltransferase [Candidatus Contubernalis alkalaceticus]